MKRALSVWKSFLSRNNGTQLRKGRGSRTNGRAHVPRGRIESLEERLALTWDVATLDGFDNGPVDRRIDMVYVGDGFVLSDQNYNHTIDSYRDKVATVIGDFFAAAPFDVYASYFNVHRVDVISNDWGVDRLYRNPAIDVNTALDGSISVDNWISVRQAKATEAAGMAPDWDLLQILVNSSDGLDSTGNNTSNLGSGIAVLSKAASSGVHLHEVGHSLGKLGDEYVTHSGSNTVERNEPNLTSISSPEAMIAAGAKWHRWLTEDHPEIGVILGGDYATGVYRPSQSSRMRIPDNEFDVVDKEALIIEMYKHPDISTIDDATAAGAYHYGQIFEVTPMTPTHELSVQWFVGGDPVPGATDLTFDTSYLTPSGVYEIKVEVIDNTTMVRDEGERELWMKNIKTWSVGPTLKVTTGVDENNTNPSALSLREAIAKAALSSYPGTDEITFAPWVSEILLGDQLIIDTDVQIIGNGANALTIDAQHDDYRVFTVNSGKMVTISGLTMTGGLVTGSADGGGIHNSGNLTLNEVVLLDNEAGDAGGGIYNAGNLTILDSTIEGNQAARAGGILHTGSGAHLEITGSSLISNDASGGHGGGLYVYSISGGTPSSASIINSTISDNFASNGAGVTIHGTPTVDFVNTTIAFNEASNQSGGIWRHTSYSPIIVLHNTIVAANLAGSSTNKNFFGSIDVSSSHNLVGPGNTGGLVPNDNKNNIVLSGTESPGLRVLGYYGGPTKTHALDANSPAIDRGKDSAVAAFDFDQRHDPRFYDALPTNGGGGVVDIGAFEFSVPRILNVIVSSTVANPFGSNPPFEFAGQVGDETQLRPVPVGGGVSRIKIQFSKDVDIDSDDLQVVYSNVYYPTTVALIEEPTIANEYTATWSVGIENPSAHIALAQGQIVLRVRDSLEDFGGNKLDGEWINPTYLDLEQYNQFGASQITHEFPSGDGSAGGDFEFVFTFVHGDVNRDALVNILDIQQLVPNMDLEGMSWEEGDFDGAGIVNILDLQSMMPYYQLVDLRALTLLGDYDNDFDIDDYDEEAFLEFYEEKHIDADLTGHGVTDADFDAFYERLGITLVA